MSSKRFLHIVTCSLLAAVGVSGAYWLDQSRNSAQQIATGLSWARQVVSQAEGLTLKARENGEKDPVGWAVNYLAQGVEPRIVRVFKFKEEKVSVSGSESHKFDSRSGLFEYSKVVMSENGNGVRIQISLGYVGFLGSRSTLTNDSLLFFAFSLFFGILFFPLGRYLFGFRDTDWLRQLISEWAAGAKAQLTRLGVHIREMVREAQRLAVSSGRSRQLVGELREKIHSQLTELHESRHFFQEAERVAQSAENLALSTAIEANRIGGEAKRIADMASEVHRSIQKMHALTKQSQSLIQRVERAIEPWATDADLAFHSFEEVKDATESMGQHIRKTTETLLGQAKLIQRLDQELGKPEALKPQPTLQPPPYKGEAKLPEPLPALPEKKKKGA